MSTQTGGENALAITIPPGIVVAFAGDNIPAGWELCDGRSVDRNDPRFTALFNAIGTIHGGDANPNFQLPDYRGRFLRGVDRGSGRDPEAGNRTPPGENNTGNGGALVGSVQGDALASHNHTIHGKHLEGEGGNGFDGAGFDSNSNPGGPFERDYGTNAAGGSETRPKNAYVNFLIKL